MSVAVGILVLRALFGAAIAAHGAQKLFGWFGGYGLKGTGGVIVVSPKGEIAWSFNTPGMYRASLTADSPARISIFKDEP